MYMYMYIWGVEMQKKKKVIRIDRFFSFLFFLGEQKTKQTEDPKKKKKTC